MAEEIHHIERIENSQVTGLTDLDKLQIMIQSDAGARNLAYKDGQGTPFYYVVANQKEHNGTSFSNSTNVFGTTTTDNLTVATTFTLTLTDITAGSILFAGASGLITQDNANLFFDNGNNRLCIGTNTSLKEITLNGDFRFTDGANRLLDVEQSASGVGKDLTIAAGQGEDGDNAGGKLTLKSGAFGVSGNINTDLDIIGSNINLTLFSTKTAFILETSIGSLLGPRLNLYRNNSTDQTAGDLIGRVRLSGNDAGDLETEYAAIQGKIKATTGGSEAGELQFFTANAGAGGAATLGLVINELQQVGINVATPDASKILHAEDNNNGEASIMIRNTTAGTAAFTGMSFGSSAGINSGTLRHHSASHTTLANVFQLTNQVAAGLELGTSGTTRMTIASGGNIAMTNDLGVLGTGSFGIATSASGIQLHVEANGNTGGVILIRNTTAGTAAFAGISYGSSGNQNAGTLRHHSASHSSLPNHFELVNQLAGPLALGTSGTTRMTIESSGILTINNQSRARAFLDAGAQSITTATATKIQFDGETYDEQSEFDSTTNFRFTATTAGHYHVCAKAEFQDASWTAGNQIILELRRSGTLIADLDKIEIEANGTMQKSVRGSDIVSLAIGQFLEIFIFQDSGGNRSVDTNEEVTYVAIHKIS